MSAILFLVFEILLACLVLSVIGYLLDKVEGAWLLPAGTLLLYAVAAVLVFAVYKFWTYFLCWSYGYQGGRCAAEVIPWGQLDPLANTFAHGYLGKVYLVLEVAIWACALGGILGYFFDKDKGGPNALVKTLNKIMSAWVLEAFVLVTALICFTFALVPPNWPGLEFDDNLSLLLGMGICAALGAYLLSKLVKKPRFRLVLALWLSFYFTCWLGYAVAGRLGFLLVTLPVVLTFWAYLYRVSVYTLPVQPEQRTLAFRSLVTFALGTNYPYYVIDDWKNQKTEKLDKPTARVDGNPFDQFFAGPGIVLNDCNHLAVMSSGFKHWIAPPGLSFTWQYDQLYADVDLRPQLRIKIIEAETKDGIKVKKILTFMPHRIGTGGRTPQLGASFPFSEDAVLKAVWDQMFVEHDWERDEQGVATEKIKRILWDELIVRIGQPILKNIVAQYTCNELHAPGDPRVKIAKAFKEQMDEAMAKLGIEMVGGGISNIVVDDKVDRQRIENWAAQWKSKIEVKSGEMDAEEVRQLERVGTEAQLEVISELTEIFEKAQSDNVTEAVLAFQLVEALRTGGEQGPSESLEEGVIASRL
ncbi:MAG: hypothetical protein JW850_10215 [Thermoflexales bacterium]|nr:hypothetical protein [Thermoflexales bacterium]